MGRPARRHRSSKNAAHAARQYHHRWRDRCAVGRGGRGQTVSRLRSRVLSCSPPRRLGHVASRGLGPRARLGARFVLAEGIAFVAQPAQSLSAASSAIPTDPWRLGAMHAVTTLTGSALIAIALARGALSVDAAWAAAHVDEDWNMKFWGRDA